MLKIIQVRLQQYVNWEIPDVQAGFRKGRGTRDQIANIRWITEKAREFQKTSTSALLTDYAKAFDCVEHNKLWKILKEMGIRPPYLSPEKSVCRSRSNSWNRTWNNGLLQNWERSILSRLYTDMDVYCHSAYLTSMQGISYEMLGWMYHKLESRLPGKYQQPQICR